MPPPFPVILAPYDPGWPAIASRHAAHLQILGPTLVITHHVGSTSVPGLAAKPIIDLMPLITDLADLDRHQSAVESLGYQWHGEYGIPGRRYCTLSDPAGTRIVQLHFFQADSPDVPRHLAFRDYLRAHPEAARAYETEKRRAQKLHATDVHAYTDEKAAWIKKTEAAALLWYAANR